MLRDTTSRGLYVRVWPPHTSERRGGGGGCEQEGWQGGGIGALKRRLPAWWSSSPNPQCRSLGARDSDAGRCW